ncbi:hypothetical protein HAX54_053141, partial [Datura stramonium]|nr:hypothetical protein [Datura stramonium]
AARPDAQGTSLATITDARRGHVLRFHASTGLPVRSRGPSRAARSYDDMRERNLSALQPAQRPFHCAKHPAAHQG